MHMGRMEGKDDPGRRMRCLYEGIIFGLLQLVSLVEVSGSLFQFEKAALEMLGQENVEDGMQKHETEDAVISPGAVETEERVWYGGSEHYSQLMLDYEMVQGLLRSGEVATAGFAWAHVAYEKDCGWLRGLQGQRVGPRWALEWLEGAWAYGTGRQEDARQFLEKVLFALLGVEGGRGRGLLGHPVMVEAFTRAAGALEPGEVRQLLDPQGGALVLLQANLEAAQHVTAWPGLTLDELERVFTFRTGAREPRQLLVNAWQVPRLLAALDTGTWLRVFRRIGWEMHAQEWQAFTQVPYWDAGGQARTLNNLPVFTRDPRFGHMVQLANARLAAHVGELLDADAALVFAGGAPGLDARDCARGLLQFLVVNELGLRAALLRLGAAGGGAHEAALVSLVLRRGAARARVLRGFSELPGLRQRFSARNLFDSLLSPRLRAALLDAGVVVGAKECRGNGKGRGRKDRAQPSAPPLALATCAHSLSEDARVLQLSAGIRKAMARDPGLLASLVRPRALGTHTDIFSEFVSVSTWCGVAGRTTGVNGFALLMDDPGRDLTVLPQAVSTGCGLVVVLRLLGVDDDDDDVKLELGAELGAELDAELDAKLGAELDAKLDLNVNGPVNGNGPVSGNDPVSEPELKHSTDHIGSTGHIGSTEYNHDYIDHSGYPHEVHRLFNEQLLIGDFVSFLNEKNQEAPHRIASHYASYFHYEPCDEDMRDSMAAATMPGDEAGMGQWLVTSWLSRGVAQRLLAGPAGPLGNAPRYGRICTLETATGAALARHNIDLERVRYRLDTCGAEAVEAWLRARHGLLNDPVRFVHSVFPGHWAHVGLRDAAQCVVTLPALVLQPALADALQLWEVPTLAALNAVVGAWAGDAGEHGAEDAFQLAFGCLRFLTWQDLNLHALDAYLGQASADARAEALALYHARWWPLELDARHRMQMALEEALAGATGDVAHVLSVLVEGRVWALMGAARLERLHTWVLQQLVAARLARAPPSHVALVTLGVVFGAQDGRMSGQLLCNAQQLHAAFYEQRAVLLLACAPREDALWLYRFGLCFAPERGAIVRKLVALNPESALPAFDCIVLAHVASLLSPEEQAIPLHLADNK